MAASDAAVLGSPGFGAGAAFYKLTGSGNDFVAFDRFAAGADAALPNAATVRALCRRGLGVGADGVMVLRPAAGHDYELVYFNADGSRAELCGNASLCSVRLAVELGHASPAALRFLTGSGSVAARIADGLPEIDLPPPTEVRSRRDDLAPDGSAIGDRIGFARVGVPHVVIRCADAGAVDVPAAAPHFRHHPSLRDGANVNFASRDGGGRVVLRTFERGVEAETLACGTGSIATAVLLAAWERTDPAVGHGRPSRPDERHGAVRQPAAGAGDPPAAGAAVDLADAVAGDSETEIVTRSGLIHRVRVRAAREDEAPRISLAGAARVVYVGELREGDWESVAA